MKRPSLFRLFGLMAGAVLGLASPSGAIDYSIQDAASLTTGAVNSMIETMGVGADHRPYRSATPLGVAIGIDAGIEATLIALPQSFKDALAVSGNTKNLPAAIPIPKFVLHKGLPFNLDIGGSWIGFQRQQVFGGDLQWAFLTESDRDKKRDILLPHLAVRYSYSHSRLWFLKTDTHALDLVASYSIGSAIDPYLGLGYQKGSGSIELSDPSVPLGLSLSHSYTGARAFLGLPIKMVFLNLTPEVNYSFLHIVTYGAKLSVAI